MKSLWVSIDVTHEFLRDAINPAAAILSGVQRRMEGTAKRHGYRLDQESIRETRRTELGYDYDPMYDTRILRPLAELPPGTPPADIIRLRFEGECVS